MRWKIQILIGGSLLLMVACNNATTTPVEEETYHLDLPPGFPEPEIPEDNQLTPARIALGKQLFFDPILSRDSTIACASCHFQEDAFSDTRRLSVGIEGRVGMRNAPSLANVAYLNSFFRDGGVPTLELQVLAPIDDENEMDFNIVEVAERLQRIPAYVTMSQEAYNRPPDPFVIIRAIAAFERTMISGNSPFDQYYYQGDATALTASQIKGMELFMSDSLNCYTCHSGFNFTDNNFYNIGLYETYKDTGRARIVFKEEHNGEFKVPSLRNVEVTAPYMHNGSMRTLEEVIDHFASGGEEHVNKSALMQSFVLTEEEKKCLIDFLNSLTDQSFLENKAFAKN